MLTKPQCEVLTFLDRQTRAAGYCPSYQEIADAVGYKARSRVHAIVCQLMERGFLRRTPGHARSLEVVRRPDGAMTQADLMGLLKDMISEARVIVEHTETTHVMVPRDLWLAISKEVEDMK